jgi:hypothetical protein
VWSCDGGRAKALQYAHTMLMAFLFQQEGTVRGDLWGLTCVSTVPYKRPGRWITSQGRWLHPAQVEGASNLPPPSATCSRELSSLSAG